MLHTCSISAKLQELRGPSLYTRYPIVARTLGLAAFRPSARASKGHLYTRTVIYVVYHFGGRALRTRIVVYNLYQQGPSSPADIVQYLFSALFLRQKSSSSRSKLCTELIQCCTPPPNATAAGNLAHAAAPTKIFTPISAWLKIFRKIPIFRKKS